MRAGILKLVIASMLFVSVEGIAESVDEVTFHQTHHAHVDDAANQWFPDSDGDEHKGDACEHFCHVHVVGLIAEVVLGNLPHCRDYDPVLPAHTITQSTAPPTPPPNL